MSVTASQEHSYLKVLFDFQYKTAEGREIIIKKNERLYLLQKTNADWWQVVRNLEQRSFYVPATYVREVSKISASSTRKNSEEDREGIFEPPQDPSYKSMPKESSNAMRNVKKWLAGAIDSKLDPSKAPYDSEAYQRSDSMEGGSKGRLKVGLVDMKTKSLERDRRSGHFSDREEDAINGSPRSRDSGEYHENPGRIPNRFSTSPKSSGLQFRIEASLPDPFRRELESSLDRRNLGVKAKLGTRIRTRSTNSEGSHVESDGGAARDSGEKIDTDSFTRNERKSNLSIHEESPRDSQSSSGTSRNSRSLDHETSKFSLRGERSMSPKPTYGRQMTIASGSIPFQEEKVSTSDSPSGTADHKILNDKRRTWAVEELMSELTQMCKERVVNKKPAFQLKSTEIKTNFDPIEKLTNEIHEMNRLRSETNVPGDDDTLSTNASPINVCKISINSINSATSVPTNSESAHEDSIVRNEEMENLHKNTEDSVKDASKVKDFRKSATFTQSEVDPVVSSSPKTLKSPKSPKILDEYNEANILNDCNTLEGALRSLQQRSLSPDKQSFYQKRMNSTHPSVDKIEVPCYSNVKINADRVKLRPKLRIKMAEPAAELRLTPSLEKLASEIQFLPARRTSQTEKNKSTQQTLSTNDEDGGVGDHDEASKSDDSLERHGHCGIMKNIKQKLEYRGSFKTKHEEKYAERQTIAKDGDYEMTGKKSGLKKSSTLHCATIPECYRRFRKHELVDRYEPVLENSMTFKRRSRSLSDLESLEIKFAEMEIKRVDEIPKMVKSKPVPLPRTKIPAVKSRESPSIGHGDVEGSNFADKKMILMRSNIEKLATRNIVEGITSKERSDNTQEEDDTWQSNKYDLPSFLSLEKYHSNTMDVNGRRNMNIESSTAVGFKTLLCASDSGSDNCLQSKELLSSSNDNLNDQGSLRSARKSSSSANFNVRSKTTRESLSDEQILSSNASSEALHSESEKTATLDISSQPSPVNATSGQDTFECAIDLPPGWKQKIDSDTGQICFLNEQGDKIMDDECCMMEEKSLLGCFHSGRKCETSITEEEDGLSQYRNNESPIESAWLPDELRRKMSQSFENVREQQSYPVMDWLKEIRLSCDLYDVGLPVSDKQSPETGRDSKEWSSSEEFEDLSDVEEIYIDERDISEGRELSQVDDENVRDIESETNRSTFDNEVIQIEESEAGRNSMTQLHVEHSSENDKNWENQEKAKSFSSLLNEINPTRGISCMVNSASMNHFRLVSGDSKFQDSNQSMKLSDLIFCLDDERTLKYCDRYLANCEHLSDDSCLSTLSVGSSRESVDSWENNMALKVLDDELSRYDSLEENLERIDNLPVASDYGNNLPFYRTKRRFNETDISSEEIGPIFQWIEQFEDTDALREIYDAGWLSQQFHHRHEEYENLSRIHTNSKSVDSTMLDRNLDRDVKTTVPVIHWIETFNNLNALEESTQSTDRISINTFNIFDDMNESGVEEFRELCDNSSNDLVAKELRTHAGLGAIERLDLDKSIEKIENIKEYHRRKGSVSSDIIVWKRNLWNEFLDDEESVDQWFSSNDAEGKIYFFEENSNESSWVLPPVETGKSQSIRPDEQNEKLDIVNEKTETGNLHTSVLANQSIVSRELPTKKLTPAGGDWPHLCDGNNMLVLKEGIINRTKITENGKKLRKNWSTSYAVLTELFLLFFKDAKTFTMMKTGQSSMAKPDISVDLNGALVEPGERASSRKNVYMISTVLGLQVLVQSDNTTVATEWFQDIHGAIRKLPSGFKSQGKPLPITTEIRKTSGGKQPVEISPHEDTKKSSKIARSRSMKMKRLDDSLEDLSGSAAERQTKIKAKLRRFFQRRPAVELLVKNGIYKDEPAFGSYLSDVCPTESPRIPLFVKTCIEVLESEEENMKTDGLYRASGNLSQIQKIRLQVDQYKLDVLAQEEDVHVLAGALKLFFRELKEPLIPSSFFKEAVNASMLKKSSTKIQCFREIVKALPPPNYDTLQFLLKHLLRVTSYQEFNRMHIPNLAIVFGPTLMWPAEESANMALDFMQQNLVIECLLSEYNKIFK